MYLMLMLIIILINFGLMFIMFLIFLLTFSIPLSVCRINRFKEKPNIWNPLKSIEIADKNNHQYFCTSLSSLSLCFSPFFFHYFEQLALKHDSCFFILDSHVIIISIMVRERRFIIRLKWMYWVVIHRKLWKWKFPWYACIFKCMRDYRLIIPWMHCVLWNTSFQKLILNGIEIKNKKKKKKLTAVALNKTPKAKSSVSAIMNWKYCIFTFKFMKCSFILFYFYFYLKWKPFHGETWMHNKSY